MILTAVRESVGCEELNGIAFERMRAWIVGVGRDMLARPETTTGSRNQISADYEWARRARDILKTL